MKLNEQKFTAFCTKYKNHDAVTHSFSTKEERDEFAIKLKKKKGVAYVKNLDKHRFGGVEYWTTEHIAEKDKSTEWIKQKLVAYSKSRAKLYS